MDFIVGLPHTQKGYDSIWVIVDRLTKSAHFLPIKTCYTATKYAELYVSRIVSPHGVPHTITSDRGSLFVCCFWEQLQVALGTNLIRSSAYHPQTSGQVERINQILEDMLRACALTYSTKWDECLPLVEFAYNNSYQKSLEMAPFEVLYGRRCRTPLNWSELDERVTFGPDLVTQAEEQVKYIHENLRRAQSRQKSYSDRRRRPLVFQKDDHVYLRVSPTKGVHRFGVKGKLAPRYVGPFKIIEQCGPVAYRLELPSHLAAVHDVFHVSQLKKCLRVVDTSQIQIEPDLTYEEKPVKVLDQKQRSTRRKAVNFYKVHWSNHSEEEATWETEEYLQTKYPVATLSGASRAAWPPAYGHAAVMRIDPLSAASLKRRSSWFSLLSFPFISALYRALLALVLTSLSKPPLPEPESNSSSRRCLPSSPSQGNPTTRTAPPRTRSRRPRRHPPLPRQDPSHRATGSLRPRRRFTLG
ncbi:hypothetical protein U9M48_039318 [Paspalum notatum var. saurae]|uniref:Integrase catalytic domain-containing protein n=1 Tax=Paspalum notatum var. saurae TaxID=547442 RepID=A0AAQ3UJW4_PASNO